MNNAFSNMEGVLVASVQRRDKISALKQTMLQELLSARNGQDGRMIN